jgi:hypothetical protein
MTQLINLAVGEGASVNSSLILSPPAAEHASSVIRGPEYQLRALQSFPVLARHLEQHT